MKPAVPLRGDDLAYATLDYIRGHPDEWDQDVGVCGSAACFVGRAVMLGLGRRFALTADLVSPAAGLLGWTEGQVLSVYHLFTGNFTRLEQHVKAVLNGDLPGKDNA